MSRRSAIILLLVSSWRVHDLTLPRIDSEHFENGSDYIMLHPVFGSKTDHYVHRQSSWKFVKAHNDVICPVYWVRMFKKASARRREASALSQLFITARGQARVTSRTVLGGWVKSLLHAGGVRPSARVVRAAPPHRSIGSTPVPSTKSRATGEPSIPSPDFTPLTCFPLRLRVTIFPGLSQ